MMILVTEVGALVRQRPDAVAAYTLGPKFGSWWRTTPHVSAARPEHVDLGKLKVSQRVDSESRVLIVSGGQAGVTYSLTVGGQLLKVRVTNYADEISPRDMVAPAKPAKVRFGLPGSERRKKA